MLSRLIAADMAPVVVLTKPDARRSRGASLLPTPVAQVAKDGGIAVVFEPEELKDFRFELGVVVAYGRLLREEILAQAPFVNIHFSLLPRWRGAAPVERALLAGDRVTGVSLMEVAPGLDQGAVFAWREVPIGSEATALSLRGELAEVGAELLITHLETAQSAFLSPRQQAGEASYASKITREELRIDFSRDATNIARQVALGGAWCLLDSLRVKVIRARALDAASVPSEVVGATNAPPGSLVAGLVICGEGYLRIDLLQVEGRRPTEFDAFYRGRTNLPGELRFS